MAVDGNYPQRWGDYVLIQPLGSGGMGTVFLALRPAANRVCVIKRVNAETLSDPQRLERFRREADISRTLSHPAIARTIDAGDFDNEPFIAEDFVEGKTISQLTAAAASVGRRLEPWAIAHIGKHVALALAYAHRSRIVHRDIAPSNVMVDLDGDIHLIDFGLARRPADLSLTASGDFIGRVAYTPPELLTGTVANAQSDIYSLGVLLWELLVGRLPAFEELKDEPAPSTRVEAPSVPGPFDSTEGLAPAPPVPQIPRDIDRVVVRAIAVNTRERFATADEVAAALHAALPDTYDGAKELAAFLANCYDVPRARGRLRASIAEARELVDGPLKTPRRRSRRGPSTKVIASAAVAVGLVLGTIAMLPVRRAVPSLSAGPPIAPPPIVPSSPAAPALGPASLPPAPVSQAKPAPTSARMPPVTKHAPASLASDTGLLLDRARDSLTDGDFQRAALDAKQVVDIGTPRQKSAAHLILGKVLLFEGKKKEAAGEFATAIELDRANTAASDQLATLRRRGVE